MAGGTDAIPVWGIEVGGDTVRAVRVTRRTEGGYSILDYREVPREAAGPEGLLSFLRKNGLTGHPLVIALRTPTAHLASSSPSPEDEIYGPEDLRGELLEAVHPEPEDIEFGYLKEESGSYIVLSEDRPTVETYIRALESAELPAYALVSSLDAIFSLVRRNNLIEGDAVWVCMDAHWTNFVFADGRSVSHQGLPIGINDLDTEQARAAFRADLLRLIEYRRVRSGVKRERKYVLMGLDEEQSRVVGDLLPEKPVAFPADAGPVRGKGRVTLMQAMRTIRVAPAAVGAAIAGAAAPRRLELAFRNLPEELPRPPAGIGRWIAAAALLWIALAVAWFGVHRGLEDLRKEAGGPAPGAAAVDPAAEARLAATLRNARRSLAFPASVRRLWAEFPGAGDGSLATRSVQFRTTEAGAYEVSGKCTRDGDDSSFSFTGEAGR